MTRWPGVALACVALLGVGWLALPAPTPTPPALLPLPAAAANADDALQALLPLTRPTDLPDLRIDLGRRLFHDQRLSIDSSIACVSCHLLERGGADGRRVAIGVGGAEGPINAPSVFNSGFNLAQFWDGRAATLEEQAAGPIHNPLEMASSWATVLERLASDPGLRADFALAYPDGLSAANVADALATFERSLVTVNARFDRYLRGEKQILTPLEVEGYRRFREFGCISCHQGVLLGGNMFQRFGVMGDYFAGRTPSKADLGRYNVTGREEDRHVFKVPSLRNIALTAPYFHDGSTASLGQAVAIMGRYQLGRELSERDIETIVAFLETLTGEQPPSRAGS